MVFCCFFFFYLYCKLHVYLTEECYVYFHFIVVRVPCYLFIFSLLLLTFSATISQAQESLISRLMLPVLTYDQSHVRALRGSLSTWLSCSLISSFSFIVLIIAIINWSTLTSHCYLFMHRLQEV